MPQQRKQMWTAKIVPFGVLKPNANHPYAGAEDVHRRDRAVSIMKDVLAAWFQELIELQLPSVAGRMAG